MTELHRICFWTVCTEEPSDKCIKLRNLIIDELLYHNYRRGQRKKLNFDGSITSDCRGVRPWDIAHFDPWEIGFKSVAG